MILTKLTPPSALSINAEPPMPETFEYVVLGSQEAGEHEAFNHTDLATEIALGITYNGINQAVMMASPGDLEDFVKGFSLNNGIVESLEQIRGITITEDGDSYQAEVQLSSRALWSLKRTRRQLAGTSGCGICGVEAMEHALPELPPLSPKPLPKTAALKGLRERIAQAQHGACKSGALHAALHIDDTGEVNLCREDIGRHNALDKLIGAMRSQGLSQAQGFVVVTSRCSLELIQKAIRAQIGTLVTLSAPTSLSVQWARQHHLNLIHLPHHSEPRVYSHTPN